jgi:hypothetical protein
MEGVMELLNPAHGRQTTSFVYSNNIHYLSGLSGIPTRQVVSGFKQQTLHNGGDSHLLEKACAEDSMQSFLGD